jgi:hypothetical protein
MKIQVFWNMAPCTLVYWFQIFGGSCYSSSSYSSNFEMFSKSFFRQTRETKRELARHSHETAWSDKSCEGINVLVKLHQQFIHPL